MIVFLSGGTGTPKMVRGMREVLPDEEITVIVNTAEDLWIPGGFLSPDIDTLLYLFAGSLNTDTWWGIKGDSCHTHQELLRLGVDEYITVGDRDRAIHIARGEMLRKGLTLTEATLALGRALGVKARILPMTDSPVATMVRAGGREIHFQEYWVRHRGRIGIDEVIRRWEVPPRATPEVLSSLREARGVIIGPSNPISSILPILECEGVRQALRNVPVVAVSPFIGDSPISGPAAALMRARGYSPDSAGTCEVYAGLVDYFIQDIRDPFPVDGSIRADTLMDRPRIAADLASLSLTLLSKGRTRDR
ncbi:MAG: 2-phospho-L-lactate transferase [Methanolinea sp.]|nr:2-phospho-L-lactate transferase [Methanolinea sp.]